MNNLLNIKLFKILMVGMVITLLNACEINDPIAEISKPGYVAANIYLDIPSTNITAGKDVDFYAEYWSKDGIKELSIVYNIERALNYTLTYPPTGFTYKFDTISEVRDFQKIKTFEHKEDSFDAEKKAYTIEDKFPVSYTLSAIEYQNPITFDETQFNIMFPQNIVNKYREKLYKKLNYSEFKDLIVTQNGLTGKENFDSFYDTLRVDNQLTYKIKEAAVDSLKKYYAKVPVSSLLYNKNRQFYSVNFSKRFFLNTKFKIINEADVVNYSESKKITIL